MGTQDSPDVGGQQAGLGPGSLVGGTWIVERLLGKGGMGAVWLVRHQRLSQKLAAIKVLLGAGLKDEAYVRFAREADIATRIGHPNIVDVLDMAALESGEPYIVLEYLQGETLRDRLRRVRTLPFTEVCQLTRQIGSALQAAHRHDVVHRDLKPENVFLVPTDSGGVLRDHVKVLDFGISKLRGSQTLQTQEATILGTPQYMAPEQARGLNSAVDARADQFALAVMVYEMLAGKPPWSSDTPLGLLFQVVSAPTPPLGEHVTDVPGPAIQALEKALAKDADRRFGDVGAFVAALTGQPLQTLETRPSPGGTGAHGGSTRATERDTVDAATIEAQTIAAQTIEAQTIAAQTIGAQTIAANYAPVPLVPAVQAAPRRPWLGGAVVAVAVAATLAWFGLGRSPKSGTEAIGTALSPPKSGTEPAGTVLSPPKSSAEPTATVLLPPKSGTEPTGTPPVPPQAPSEADVAVEHSAEKAALRAPHPAPAAKMEDKHAELPAEVAEAEAALAAGKAAEAERLASHSLLAQRTPRAFAVLTRAHCKRGDLGGAKTWYRQIGPVALRAAVKKACAADAVEL